jgi:hypothetical protein
MINELIELSERIPSMGGREMGKVYRRYIRDMDRGDDVVEIGAWLGAGTAQLALGIYEHGKESTLHVYDRFTAKGKEIKKALNPSGYKYAEGIGVDKKGESIKVKSGQNTLPIVRKLLSEFEKIADIKYYRGDIDNLKYKGGKIGILVIDAAKKSAQFKRIIKKLEPHLLPGSIVFFMDYYYYLYKPNKELEYQRKYVEGSGKYTIIESYKNLCCAIARYDGNKG